MSILGTQTMRTKMIEFLAMMVWTWISLVVLHFSYGGELSAEAPYEEDSWPT